MKALVAASRARSSSSMGSYASMHSAYGFSKQNAYLTVSGVFEIELGATGVFETGFRVGYGY